MIERAIVEELIDDYSVRIRIPRWDKLASSAHGTPTNELSIAHICAMPGCKPHYVIGDIVYVMFERENIADPVIVGLLYRAIESNSTVDLTADSIKVKVNSSLPHDTIIGDVTPINIGNIEGLSNNAQKQINLLSERVTQLEE